MTQGERRVYLIEYLLAERPEYAEADIPAEEAEQRRMLRGLMNVRMPGPVSSEFLDIQDAYLRREAEEKGVVSLEDIPTIREQYGSGHAHGDQLSIWRGDITRLRVGAIVNAANERLLGCFVPCHGCIDNAIHSAAGVQLRGACERIMGGGTEKTGRARITEGYNLPAEHVLHTVGPIVHGRLTKGLERDLENCYRACLELAAERGIDSVAFCCISTGEFHFPNERAAEIAVETVGDFLDGHTEIRRVVFNVFKPLDLEIYRALLG